MSTEVVLFYANEVQVKLAGFVSISFECLLITTIALK